MLKLFKTKKNHMFFVGWWPVALRWLPQGAQEPILLARSLRDPRKSNEAARDLFLMQHPKFEKNHETWLAKIHKLLAPAAKMKICMKKKP